MTDTPTFADAVAAAPDEQLVFAAVGARKVYEFALEEGCDQHVVDEARDMLVDIEAEIGRRARRVNDAARVPAVSHEIHAAELSAE